MKVKILKGFVIQNGGKRYVKDAIEEVDDRLANDLISWGCAEKYIEEKKIDWPIKQKYNDKIKDTDEGQPGGIHLDLVNGNGGKE